jgi:hypothetical protein
LIEARQTDGNKVKEAAAGEPIRPPGEETEDERYPIIVHIIHSIK